MSVGFQQDTGWVPWFQLSKKRSSGDSRHRRLLLAVAALVDASLPPEPSRVPALAVRASGAVRPAAAEQILRASFVVRQRLLEQTGGQRRSLC